MKKIFETSLFFGLNWPSENGGYSEVKEIKKSPEQQKQEDIDRLNRLLDLTKKAVEQGVLTQEQADNNIVQYKKMLNQLEWKNTVENNNSNSENKENNTEQNIWNSENANQEISENQENSEWNTNDLYKNFEKELDDTILLEMWQEWTDSEYFFQEFLENNNINDNFLKNKNHDERRQILKSAIEHIKKWIMAELDYLADYGQEKPRKPIKKIQWVTVADFVRKDVNAFKDLFNLKKDIAEANRKKIENIFNGKVPENIRILAKAAEKWEMIEESFLLVELVQNSKNISEAEFNQKLEEIKVKIQEKWDFDELLKLSDSKKNNKNPKNSTQKPDENNKNPKWNTASMLKHRSIEWWSSFKNNEQPSSYPKVTNIDSAAIKEEEKDLEQNIKNADEAKTVEQAQVQLTEEAQKVTEKSWESKDSIQNVAKAIENMDAEIIKKAVSGNEKAENLVIENNSNPDANKVIETLVTGGALEYKVPNSDHPVLVRIDKNSAKLWIEYKWEFFKSNPKAIGNSYVKMFQEMASNPIFESMLSAGYSRGFKHLEQKFNSSNSTEVLGDNPNNFYRIILKELANISGFDAFNKIQSDTQIKEFNSHMQNPQNWELVRKQFETIEPPLITIDWKMRTDTWAERSSKKEELQTANIELDLWYNYLYP